MRLFNRRQFARSLIGAGAAGLLPWQKAMAADPPPETTTIRMAWSPAICYAPMYVIEAFLQTEGFTDIQYVPSAGASASAKLMADNRIDATVSYAGSLVHKLDQGLRLKVLGGLHIGCFELFAHEPIRSIGDLKGRKVGISNFSGGDYLYLSVMAKYIGLDPRKDIVWVPNKDGSAMETFIAGETDAILGFPPVPQRLRSRGISRVILNTSLDLPWSQYFCCMVYSSADWVGRHPVAAKRFLRALYKGAQFCSSNPAASARRLVKAGFEKNYDHVLETIESIPYKNWYEYDAEDSMRFYALKLHDAGLLTNPPNKLLASGTDWSFLNELKREMKG